MTKLSNFAATMFFLLLSALWNSPATAQTTKLNVGYSAISGDQLPAWVAKDAGIFQKNGLDVQLVYFTGRHDGGDGLDFSRHALLAKWQDRR